MSKKDEIIKKIKSKGYWLINIHPEVYKKERIESRSKVKGIARNAIVELRGWDYPHFRDSQGEPIFIENGIEKYINWSGYIEVWRMTQSANFVHLLALREDWLEESMFGFPENMKGKKILGVTGTLFTLTEIFEFARRLAKQNIFDETLRINIELFDINERELWIESPVRGHFFSPKKVKTETLWKWEKVYRSDEIISDTSQLSLKAVLNLFELFGWENPPKNTFMDDQRKFLEGKI